ncbi:hypothetical protein [Shinella sp. JR1-6]|uniref:hypothetical protein n=1 Tax=Shinella sp. JR1-6 TaxID=2527671 RepID=UPI00102D5979|nr:hypothetical protein [Shinella sp. JR1-6]TAA55277.1 hypothetical protein EXZ48_24915 [Shinella sp. JR1-6]
MTQPVPLGENAWIGRHTLISAERAHALGLVTLYWNFCEAGLAELVTDYSGMKPADAAHFLYGANAVSLLDLLRGLARRNEKRPDLLEALDHAITCVDICRRNRNNLAHSWVNFKGDKLFKPNRARGGNPFTEVFSFDLGEIREVAEDCYTAGQYLMHFGLHRTYLDHPTISAPLPEKLQIPQTLKSIDRIAPDTP